MARTLALFASPLQFLAVLAFFLPFYSVSCQGRPLATASGYEVSTRGFQVDESAARKLRSTSDEGSAPRGCAPWLLLFPLLAGAAGVAAAAAARGSSGALTRARARLGSAALGGLGVVLLVLHYVVVRGDLRRLLSEGMGGDGPGAEMGRHLATGLLQGISLDLQVGWYLALFALLGGTALAAAAHVAPESAPARSTAEPPPSVTPSS